MTQSFLFPDLKPKEEIKKQKNDIIIGKTDYGKRNEFCFFLNAPDYKEACKFFNFKNEHDEPNGDLLMKLIREWKK